MGEKTQQNREKLKTSKRKQRKKGPGKSRVRSHGKRSKERRELSPQYLFRVFKRSHQRKKEELKRSQNKLEARVPKKRVCNAKVRGAVGALNLQGKVKHQEDKRTRTETR